MKSEVLNDTDVILGSTLYKRECIPNIFPAKVFNLVYPIIQCDTKPGRIDCIITVALKPELQDLPVFLPDSKHIEIQQI